MEFAAAGIDFQPSVKNVGLNNEDLQQLTSVRGESICTVAKISKIIKSSFDET